MTWHDGLSLRFIDSFDTLVKQFSAQYTTSRSHRMTSVALASLRQVVDDETLRKFMDRFGCTIIQIQKPPNSMDELREQVKGYIQMEECPDSGMKFVKLDRSEKHTPRPTYASRIRGTSLIIANLVKDNGSTNLEQPKAKT